MTVPAAAFVSALLLLLFCLGCEVRRAMKGKRKPLAKPDSACIRDYEEYRGWRKS